MISYLLIAGIAYGIAYSISSTGMAIWRAVVSFLIALVVGWLGGTLVSVFLISTFFSNDIAATTLNLLGSGFWMATTGAGIGVYRARYKLHTGQNAPPLTIPKWISMSALALFAIGILAAVALPAYQDYAKRKASAEPKSWEQQYQGQSQTHPKRSQIDEFLSNAPTNQPTELPTQQNAARANPFDQFDHITARPVDKTNNRPFTYEEAISPKKSSTGTSENFWANDKPAGEVITQPKTQNTVAQEHYRRIYAAHPDADAIHDSPAFQAWVSRYPTYQHIVAQGTTQEIIEMFTAYKNQR